MDATVTFVRPVDWGVTVQYRDGIEISLSDGTRVVYDAIAPDGDVNGVEEVRGRGAGGAALVVGCCTRSDAASVCLVSRDEFGEPVLRSAYRSSKCLSHNHSPLRRENCDI